MFIRKKPWITTAHRGYVGDKYCQNTLPAFKLAAKKGADMIETDARMTSDGVLVANHDATVKGFDRDGNKVELVISETPFDVIESVVLQENGTEEDRVPTLEEVLKLAYANGMCINIDLKEGLTHAEEIARLVLKCGMRGRTVYATNGAGAEAINRILKLDPEARFIDIKENYTVEKLKDVENYTAKCYIYTGEFNDKNIEEIRATGCMLATISLYAGNVAQAFKYCPDMMEYLHTSDFEAIEKELLENATR